MIKSISEKKNLFFYIILFLVILLGIFLRTKLWIYNPGFHWDEANLARQIINKGYIDLIKPLDANQVAPPLFMVISKLFYNIVKLHNSAFFSDLIFRLFPFITGIISLPLFAYLLYILLKNKYLTIIGTVFLAVLPEAVAYSTIFKQYSLELLITILILIIFLKIDLKEKSLKYNIFLFILLGLMPFFSLSSYFVLPGGFLLVLYNSIKQKTFKKFLICSSYYFIVFLLFVLFILLPIMNKNYNTMQEYWNYRFYVDDTNDFSVFIQFIFNYVFRLTTINKITSLILISIGFISILLKNYKHCLLVFTPIIVTYLFVKTGNYCLGSRLLLFLISNFIILFCYIFKPLTLNIKYKTIINYILYIFISIILIIFYRYFSYKDLDNYYYQPEGSREVWDYLKTIYDGKTPVILGPDPETNPYYASFSKEYNFNIKYNYKKTPYNKIPPNTYYIITTWYSPKYDDITYNILKREKILFIKRIKKKSYLGNIRYSYLIKFEKL